MPDTPVLSAPVPRDALPLPAPLRVLVVDDNRDAADTLRAVLAVAGAEVQVCYDGSTALAVAGWFCPDACVLDLSMPGMDGDELAFALQERAGGHPFLLLAVTALTGEAARARTRAARFDLHLTKPVDPDDLLAVLADADWWRGREPAAD